MEKDVAEPSDAMIEMIRGFWLSRAIYLAAKLGISDLVEDGPKTADELAGLTATYAPHLDRVLRALASVGVFEEDERGRFASTPLAATLRSNVPGSLRAFAMCELGGEHLRGWAEFPEAVRTGRIAFDLAHGMPVWEYYHAHPEAAAIFNEAMTELTGLVEAAVVSAYDFAPFRTIVDVGGGHGGLLESILRAAPGARGVLFDAPRVVEGAHGRLDAEGLAGRCRRVGGDFFDSVPEGGDLYVLKWIIHDWDDAKSLAILKNCRRAMAEGSRLLLVESVIPPGNAPALGKFIDLVMMVMTGGLERTEDQFRDLLAAAGLTLTRVLPTRSPSSLVEAVPAAD